MQVGWIFEDCASDTIRVVTRLEESDTHSAVLCGDVNGNVASDTDL